MKNLSNHLAFLFLCALFTHPIFAQPGTYSWRENSDAANAIQYRIPPPSEFERIPVETNSFGNWLRNFPLKEGSPPVYLYNGQKKGNQSAQFAVMDLDVGKKDLQQCADAVMRLKAEYHFACGEYPSIHFNFTSGDRADYTKWSDGYRPKINGNNVSWVKSQRKDNSYENFRRYMETVFTYAGTHSLSLEMQPVPPENLQPGDVFIKGGFPGHAVIVMDVAQHPETGEKCFLLAQSYMPAQEMHILKNPQDPTLSPWYKIPQARLNTPEWGFDADMLRRFK